MNPDDMVALAQILMDGAIDTLRRKAPDYAPDDVCFVDLIKQCAESDIARPEQLLWTLASKHTTAIRAFCTKGELRSEVITNRTFDAINFFAIIYIWALQSTMIMRSVRHHFLGLGCECPRHAGKPIAPVCDRCLVLLWFERYHPGFRMDSTSQLD